MERAKPTAKDKPEHKGGRGLSDYDPVKYPRIAEAICRLGATNDQLADMFGVDERTIRRWIVKHKEFADAVHRGLFDTFSPRVVRSLAEQAIGYAIDVEETKVLANGQVIKYTVRKYMPPNVTACIFWLKNRMSSEWHDVRDHVVEHQNLDKLSSKELLDEIRKEVVELGIIDVDPITGIAKLNSGSKH